MITGKMIGWNRDANICVSESGGKWPGRVHWVKQSRSYKMH